MSECEGEGAIIAGGSFIWLLTYEERNRQAERGTIAGGSRAAAAEGVVGGSQGTAVRLGALLGILVLEWPGKACSTDHSHRGCSP